MQGTFFDVSHFLVIHRMYFYDVIDGHVLCKECLKKLFALLLQVVTLSVKLQNTKVLEISRRI